jgi:hypothetical protein
MVLAVVDCDSHYASKLWQPVFIERDMYANGTVKGVPMPK